MNLKSETFIEHGVIDTGAIEREIRQIEDSPLWNNPHRGKVYEAQSTTQNLPFQWAPIVAGTTFRVYINTSLLDTPMGIEYMKITEQVLRLVPGKVLHGGIVRMTPQTEIPLHYDGSHELWKACHRLHLPVITESGVRFRYETASKHLQKNTLVEINNFLLHGVIHAGSCIRYHVMYDILPESYTGSHIVEYHSDPGTFAQDQQQEILDKESFSVYNSDIMYP